MIPVSAKLLSAILGPEMSAPIFPEGPNLETIQDHPPGLKFSSEIETILKFQARLKISSEPTHQTPILWGILEVEIEIFKRD